MRRNHLVRFIAGIVGVVAGFSGPTLALSHGVAHARYAEAARAFEQASGRPTAAIEAAAETSGVVESADGPGGYYEPIHCQECAERTGIVKLALPAPPELAIVYVRRVVALAIGPRALPLASSAEFLPDQPRAPPRLS